MQYDDTPEVMRDEFSTLRAALDLPAATYPDAIENSLHEAVVRDLGIKTRNFKLAAAINAHDADKCREHHIVRRKKEYTDSAPKEVLDALIEISDTLNLAPVGSYGSIAQFLGEVSARLQTLKALHDTMSRVLENGD